jgi:hypothetical protein
MNVGHGAVFAVLTGAAIASYNLWDKHAVGAGALSPIVYVFVLHEQDVERRLAAAAAILVGVVILTLG